MGSIKEIKQSIETILNESPHNYTELSTQYKNLVYLYLREDKEEEAYDGIKKFIYYSFIDDRSYNGKVIYSFRAFSVYSVSDIVNSQITLVNPILFNDPLDTILIGWLNHKLKKENDGAKKEFNYLLLRGIQYLRVRCFVTSNQGKGSELDLCDLNPLMWAHYADSHKGFCTEYQVTDTIVKCCEETSSFTRFGDVVYSSDFPQDRGLKNKEALLWKKDIWSYENEVRLIDLDFSNNKHFKTIEAPRLNAIYLGLKCSLENEYKMKEALRSEKNKHVKLYRMKIDETDYSTIIPERVW